MNTIALFLIACIAITKVNSLEVCEKHKNLDGTKYEAQNCNAYCCGVCNRRYCCLYRDYRLNQELCGPEDCLAFFDIFQKQNQPEYCYGEFCCGSCNDRYCCSNPTRRLNQSSCAIREQTISITTSTRKIEFTFTRNSDFQQNTDLAT